LRKKTAELMLEGLMDTVTVYDVLSGRLIKSMSNASLAEALTVASWTSVLGPLRVTVATVSSSPDQSHARESLQSGQEG
jgi:hypothetical protein